jgi:hypothetical protein
MTENEFNKLFNLQFENKKRDFVTYSLSKHQGMQDFTIVSHPKSEMTSLYNKINKNYIFDFMLSGKFPRFVRSKV